MTSNDDEDTFFIEDDLETDDPRPDEDEPTADPDAVIEQEDPDEVEAEEVED